MFCIGDIHGCLDSLKALLDKLPDWQTKRVCFVGDLIDRGPKSKETVDFVMDLVQKGIADCVKGNHEAMMVDWTGSHNNMLWLGNGGKQTLDSYYERDSESPFLKGDFDQTSFDKHREWMDLLPVYIDYPEIINDEGRYLIVSHSHISNCWKRLNTEQDDHFIEQMHKEIMWGRPHTIHDTHEVYNVIGHTPQEDARIKSFYANIDTGCFYKFRQHLGEFGKLTALEFPSMQLHTQECIDDVDWSPY